MGQEQNDRREIWENFLKRCGASQHPAEVTHETQAAYLSKQCHNFGLS